MALSDPSHKELRTRWKEYVLLSHPDKSGPSTNFIAVQEAYDVLKSPAKKISYDHYLEVCERLHLHPCALLHTRLADLIIVWLSPLAHPCFVDSGRGPASFPVWGIIPTLIYNAGHDPASPSTMADYVPVPEVPGKPPTAQQPRYFPRRTKLLSPAC